MSSQRIAYVPEIPSAVRRAFLCAEEPSCPEEALWRERAARMILDALGYTGLVGKRKKHNDAVRYARRWLRGFYETNDVPEEFRDSVTGTFESAGISLEAVVEPILACDPYYMEDSNAKLDGDSSR